jgi:predicted dehydrogenase
MLKTAIVGCGKIADAHASQIIRIPLTEIVGVCDRELLMTQQFMDRFPVRRGFSDVEELLHETRPDVVHVTTPPQSHFAIAMMCLEHGCHVYVEKPFALDEGEAQRLLNYANARGLKITAGHDDQFTHVARRMRTLVQSGYLGAGPMHMESYYCYDLGSSAYARALLGDQQHWVRRLPGGLLHNVISHGIARIAEFLTGDSLEVVAYGFISPALKKFGETEMIDELRVILCEDERITAYFTFSSQMRPGLHEFRMYGTKNGLLLDHDQETLIRLPGKRLPSYAEKFIRPVGIARQHLGNVTINLRAFLHSDFHMKSGMKYLIETFYRCIEGSASDPIPHSEILLTARIMDRIFAQIGTQRSQIETCSPSEVFGQAK